MAQMTQEQLDALIGQAGGARLVHSTTVGKRKVPNPAYNKYDPKSQETVELDIQQWKSPEGYTIQAVQMDDGSWEVIQNEPPAKPAATAGTSTGTPRVPSGSVPRIEGTPDPSKPDGRDNTQPIRAWHAPDGSVVYEALTPAERQQWEREKNGGLTDEQVRQQQQTQTGEVRKPVEGRPGWTQVTRATTQGGNKTESTVFVGPDGKEVPTLPAETATGESSTPLEGYPGWRVVKRIKAEGGNKTETTVFVNPQGQEAPDPRPGAAKYSETRQDPNTGKWYGLKKDGTGWEPLEGGPGREQRPGSLVTINGESFWAQPDPANPGAPPRLTRATELPGAAEKPPPADNGPQKEPGQSPSAYLAARRQWYIDQRRAGAMTQKDVDAAWERDKEIAQSSHNEASLAATQQNQRLATSMTGVNQALSEVGQLNRYLPVGSDLGGRAVEAILGIQYGQAQRMGGYGAAPPPLAVPPSPNEPDPSSQVAAIPPAPSRAAASEVAPLTQDERAGMAAEQARRSAAMANPVFRSSAPVDVQSPAPAPAARPQVTLRHTVTGLESQVPPDFLDPSNPNHPTNMGEFEVVPPVAAIPESPYDLRARIAATPPWQMSEDEWRKAQELGIEEDFWRVA